MLGFQDVEAARRHMAARVAARSGEVADLPELGCEVFHQEGAAVVSVATGGGDLGVEEAEGFRGGAGHEQVHGADVAHQQVGEGGDGVGIGGAVGHGGGLLSGVSLALSVAAGRVRRTFRGPA